MIRTVNEVIESFRLALATSGSKLKNFAIYSNLYSLYRSIAAVITEHEIEVLSIKDGFFLNTAIGEDLDKRAADFNLFRKTGSNSTGYILVKNNVTGGVKLPAGTILSTANNIIQLETLQSIDVIGNLTEVSIEVQSLSFTPDANLPPGTLLYSNLYPSLQFTVGRFRNPLTLIVEGNLAGGRSLESDEDFRFRVKNFLSTLSMGTYTALVESVLTIPNVTKVYVKEHTPVTGYITVYIDNNSIDVLRRVTRIIDNSKAAGVAYVVKPLQKLDLVISLEIEVRRSQNLESIINQIRNSILAYLDNLDVGKSVTPEAIAGLGLAVTGVLNVRVLNPSSPIVLDSEQILNVTNVIISSVISR